MAWRDIGRNRKMTCMQGTQRDQREAEDRCAHLSASPPGGRRPHCFQWLKAPLSRDTRRHDPSHCPIFHCQGPARAQFIMAMFGNYPCKCRVIPPDKGLIALKGASQSISDTLVWSASAIMAPHIWAGPRTHS